MPLQSPCSTAATIPCSHSLCGSGVWACCEACTLPLQHTLGPWDSCGGLFHAAPTFHAPGAGVCLCACCGCIFTRACLAALPLMGLSIGILSALGVVRAVSSTCCLLHLLHVAALRHVRVSKSSCRCFCTGCCRQLAALTLVPFGVAAVARRLACAATALA